MASSRLAFASALVTCFLSGSTAWAQYCPSVPPPDEPDERPKKRESDATCESAWGAGDPIILPGQDTYTFDRLEDIFLESPLGGFSFQRTYISHDLPWRGITTSLKAPYAPSPYTDWRLYGIPVPFGKSRTTDVASLRWTHSLFSFVDVRPAAVGASAWVVRPPTGTQEEFGICTNPPCWAPVDTNSPGQSNRLLRRASGGFEYHQADGKRYVYEAVTADAGLYFLSELDRNDGTPIATVSYATPPGCVGLGAADSGIPYVGDVNVGGVRLLRFGYSALGTPQECVLSSVKDVATDAGLAAYAYNSNLPGLLSGATTPEYAETFEYSPGFRVRRDGVLLVQHDATSPTSTTDRTGVHSVGSLTGTGYKTGNGALCAGNMTPQERAVFVPTALIGNNTTQDAGLFQVYMYSAGYDESRHTAVPLERRDSCSSNYPFACSPGIYRWVQAGVQGLGTSCSIFDDSNPAYRYATKNKRDNWTVTPSQMVVLDGGLRAFEQLSLMEGVAGITTDVNTQPNLPRPTYPDPSSSNALQITNFTYQYVNGIQSLATETKPSAISGTTTLMYRRDSSNRLIARIQSGSTKLLDGTVPSTKYLAHFYTYDSAGRILTESGPCFVSLPTDSSCPTGSPQITTTYYTSGSSTGMVQTVSRAVGDGGVLTTTFGDYSPLGEPGSIRDENDVTTPFTYQGHQVMSRTLLQADAGVAAQWTYTWENERLTSIGFPEGNFETYCYRANPGPGSCSGAWTSRLQSKSRAASASGTGWTEAMVYEYWGDGTLKAEHAYISQGGTPLERRFAKYSADAHKRPTFAGWGTKKQLADKRGYDGADNLAAVGSAYNDPPDWCRSLGGSDSSAGTLSRLCAQMGYDRAERLRSLDLFRDSTSPTPTRACIDYDRQGHVSRVTTGCGASDTCSTDNIPSTCGGSADFSNDYLTDDFGNVVEVTLNGTDNGSGGRGVFRYEYDAMGNVVAQQTEAQRAEGWTPKLTHTYDALGRRLRSYEVWLTTPYTVAEFDYDGAGAPPPSGCPLPKNTKGRLTRVWDPLITRWYQYDLEGRVTKESRVPEGATSCTGDLLHLAMSYSLNGNLTSMKYGHGREVQYTYGSGGNPDRPEQVDVNLFLADGGVSTRTIAYHVEWEPYGGLNYYRFFADETFAVTYEHGAAKDDYSSGCPTGDLGEDDDLTGRVRSVRVQIASSQMYRKTYKWSGDEVVKTATCYRLGQSGYLEEDFTRGSGFGYDGTGQLLGVNAPEEGTTSGPYRARKYTYDSRGNLATQYVELDAGVSVTYVSYFDAGVPTRADWMLRIGSDSWNGSNFSYDRDGRITSIEGPADSTTYGSVIGISYQGDNAIGPGSGSVFRQTSISQPNGTASYYSYWYDIWNRRQAKEYSLNELFDRYFYDLGHQLLEDRGYHSLTEGEPFPIDEYVWLGGRPIAVIRAKLDKDLGRYPDDIGECSRMGDKAACGTYWIISDHLYRPVLTIDQTSRIAGAAEYDPYGGVNRRQSPWQTSHPYGNGAISGTFIQVQQREMGMKLDFRFHFPMVDTEQTCTGDLVEGPSIWRDDLSYMEDVQYGHGRGNVWTPWIGTSSVSGWGKLQVGWGAVSGNQHPTDCGSGTKTWPYAGFVLREYEYRRYDNGATPYFPPLRFPGHYWDAETDTNENWHRNYYPFAGRYLSPEPLLVDPEWVASEASQGFQTATYGYALNNPVKYTDPDGLTSFIFEPPPNLPKDAPFSQRMLCGFGMFCDYEPPPPSPPGTCPIPGRTWREKGSRGPSRGPKERKQDRKNPNPDKKKSKDNQDGQKLPPKAPPPTPFKPPPATKQPKTE